ncbi:MAG: hypothetical protein JZU70_00360, partial [Chlorobium sp.]|nr:hypothetical protein [Chlorobium sp.]
SVTIHSSGANANTITGSIIAVDPDGAGSKIENNLLNITIDATQTLTIGGDLVFTSVATGTDKAAAELTITGSAAVTVQQLDVKDAQIDSLTIANNGTGTFTVTGASPALFDDVNNVADPAGTATGTPNLETLTLKGTGNIVLGSNAAVTTEWGITAANLSKIDASALSGNLDLGLVKDIDSDTFEFIAGSGVTKLTLAGDTLVDGADVNNDAASWSFDFTTAKAGSELHLGLLGAAVSNTYGVAVTDVDGIKLGDEDTLNIKLGDNTTLYIDANTDFTNIESFSLTGVKDIVLADGVTLTLTAAQANGLHIKAGVDTFVAGITAQVNVVGLGDTPVDLSHIATEIAGNVELADDDVTLGVYDSAGNLTASTNLGDFTVVLNSRVDAGGVSLVGQTVRFATVEQADNAVRVINDADDAAGVNSTNVVWLFGSVAVPVNTTYNAATGTGYDPLLGRLWISEALANGTNVEQLFTSLPESIVRVDFSSIEALNVLLPSSGVNRTVELVAFTQLANGLSFSDHDKLEHVHNLIIEMGGSVSAGNLAIDNVVNPTTNVDLNSITFDTLTINSMRALHEDHHLAPDLYVNDNDGVNDIGENEQPVNLNTIGNITVGSNNGLDLKTVILNTYGLSSTSGAANAQNSDIANYNPAIDAANLALSQGAALKVGKIVFDAEVTGQTATLDVNGANNVTIETLDTSDAQISSLVVNAADHSAVLLVTGGSPAAAVANTETLTINPGATGTIYFGYEEVKTGDVVTGYILHTDAATGKPYAGVAGADLSNITVDSSGEVYLGVIGLIDSTDDVGATTTTKAFTLVGNGHTFAQLGEANVDGVIQHPVLAAGSRWAIQDATIKLTDKVTLGAGQLSLTNVSLIVEGNVDFTTLTRDNLTTATVDEEGLTLAGTTTIDVPTGSTLKILAEDASGLTITGGGTVTIEDLELIPDADLSNIMTNEGDTGHVIAIVDTTDTILDDNTTPDTITFAVTAELGIAEVHVIGGGILDATNVLVANMTATIDRDPSAVVTEETVLASFVVEGTSTLVLTAAQGDDRTVTGTGTTNVEDISLVATGLNNTLPLALNLASVNSGTVNIAVDNNATLDRFDNLGTPGATRVITIKGEASTEVDNVGVTLTAAGSVISGQYIIGGNNATVVVDDQNDGAIPAVAPSVTPTDTPITADLRHVSVEYINLVDGAAVGTIQFPTLYGDPVKKYIDDGVLPVNNGGDLKVAVQTVTLTAAQANGQTITGIDLDGAGSGVALGGEVIVNKLGEALVDLSLIQAGKQTAHVPDQTLLDPNDWIYMAAGTKLGLFDVVLDNNTVKLDLSAAQANGRNITDGSNTAWINVYGLEALPAVDLSKVVVTTITDGHEAATLDLTNGDVTFTGNLGAGFIVTVTDDDAPVDNTLTFNGSMESDKTSFDLADDVKLVIDAAKANLLHVTDDTTNNGIANTSVTVNNLGSAQVDFTHIDGNNLVVNVPVDVTLNAATVIDTGYTGAGYSAIPGVATDGTPGAAEYTVFTVMETMQAGDTLTIDGLTITATTNVDIDTIVNTLANLGDNVPADSGLTISGGYVTPAGWTGTPTVVGNTGANTVTFTNTVLGDVTNFTASTGFVTTTNNFHVVLAEGVDLGLTVGQLLDIDESDISGTAGGVSETLIVSGYTGIPAQDIQSDELGANVVISKLIVTGGTPLVTNNVVVSPNADLTKVLEIVVPQYTTLTMTADQFQQLLGNAGVTVSGGGILNLTNFDNTNATINLSTVTAVAGTILLDPLATSDVILPILTDGVVVVDPLAKLDTATGDKFDFLFSAANQSLTLSSETQADGRVVTDLGVANSKLVLGFINDDVTDANAIIESAGFHVDNLWVINKYIENEFGIVTPVGSTGNFEYFLNNLDESVLVTVVDVDTLLANNLSYPGYIADPTDRVVDIAHDTGLSANVAFSDLAVGEEVGSLYLTLRGNSTISGNLALPQYKDPQTSIATPNSATMPHFFESLTIESNNTVRNADGTFSAAGGADPGPNEITGSIFADNGADLTESTAEVFTLTLNPGLTIDGAQDQIFFDGEVVTLINGNNADAVAARIAAAFPASAVGTHWTATASNNVVTFTNKDVGNVVTDVALSNFTFVKNGVLTANLTGVVAKVNDGSVVGNENNLTNVTIVADHELLIGGEIEFRYVTRSSDGSMIPTTDEHAATTTAVLTIDGNAHVQIGALNTDDAHITGLAIDHTGAGVVDIVGTSPAAAVSNTEQLIINNNGGLINFGTGNGTTTLATTKPGVSGSALSLIDVNGSGDVDLKVIADVDSNGGTNGGFTLDATGSDGNVTAIITDDLTGGTWNFLNGEDGTLNLTIRGDGTAPTGVDGADFTSGTLNLNGVTLILDGNVDLSDITLSIIGGTVNLTADSSLTVTCAQADTLAITGAAGSTIYVVDAESGDIFEGLNVPNINLLGITSTDPLDIPASTVVLDNSHFGAATQSYNIIGSNFADAIIGGSLADTISGGLGNDTITAGTATGDTILVTGGTDTITDLSAIGSDTITTNDDVLVVSGTASATANNVSQFIATAGTSNTSSGTVILNGTAVADTINMTLATGTAGYVINGNAGADTLTGSNFADSITGGADVDSLIGGLGNDTIGGADTDALIDGDNGTVSGGGTADVLQVVGDFIYGTDANLRNVEIVNQTVTNHTINLTGQTESFTINGTVFIADDLVSNPTVAGQSGDDTIVGGSGNDTINSLSGNDNLFGGAGNDSIVAGDGNDQLTGGAGIDNLNGGNGIDLFAFGNSEFVAGETIDGGANTDTLLFTTADHAAFTVTNGDGNGLTTYETLAFTILPNGQVLNAGQSIAIAGRTVTATADGMTGANVATLFNGTAVTGLTIAPASFTTPANWTGVVAASAVGNVFTLRNTDFINVGTALPVSGTLGETINDAAFANKTGLEVIDLGDGTNSLTLGTIAAAATATPTVYGGTGVDTVNASTLGEAVTIEGNAGNDVLTGSALADSILGEAGADTITGGAGVDNLSGGTEADLFVFGNGEFVAGETVDGGADTDTIRLADAQTVADATFTNKTTLEKIEMGNGINSLTLGINAAAATATLTVTGGTGADTVNASALGEALTIDGGTGNDILTGSSATDLIVGGEGDDTFNYVTSEFVAAETVQGGLGNDTIRFTNVAQDYAVTPSPTDGGFALAEAAIFTITQVMNAGQSLTINGLTVTATADGIAADQVALAFSGTAVAGLTLSGTLGTPTNWTGTPVLTTVDLGATGTVTLTNTVFGNVTNFIAYSTGSKAIVDGDFVNKSALEAIVLANGTNSLTLAANAAAATSNLTVTGGTGADTVNATVLGKSVTIDGGNGNDVLIGSNQIDSILGGAGDDSITGGLLADSLNGGEGSDTYIYASNADFITGGAVVDSINDAGATGTDRALISGAISIVRTDSLAGAIGVDQLVAATDATALHHSIVINNNSALQNVRTIDLSGSNNSGSSSVVTLANAAYNAVVGAVTDGVDLTSPEVTTFTLTQVMNAGQSLTINGRTVTATDNGNTAGQLAEAFRTGVSGAGLTVSGAFNTPAGWTGVPADWTGAPGVTGAGATIIFTNTVDGDVTTQFTASTGSAASALTTGVTVIGVLNGTNDFIGSDGNDTLTGGAGADTINGGAGNDTIVGGAGNDLVNYDSGDISVDGGNDTDTLTAADVTGGPVSIDLASTTDAFANLENIIG